MIWLDEMPGVGKDKIKLSLSNGLIHLGVGKRLNGKIPFRNGPFENNSQRFPLCEGLWFRPEREHPY